MHVGIYTHVDLNMCASLEACKEFVSTHAHTLTCIHTYIGLDNALRAEGTECDDDAVAFDTHTHRDTLRQRYTETCDSLAAGLGLQTLFSSHVSTSVRLLYTWIRFDGQHAHSISTRHRASIHGRTDWISTRATSKSLRCTYAHMHTSVR